LTPSPPLPFDLERVQEFAHVMPEGPAWVSCPVLVSPPSSIILLEVLRTSWQLHLSFVFQSFAALSLSQAMCTDSLWSPFSKQHPTLISLIVISCFLSFPFPLFSRGSFGNTSKTKRSHQVDRTFLLFISPHVCLPTCHGDSSFSTLLFCYRDLDRPSFNPPTVVGVF